MPNLYIAAMLNAAKGRGSREGQLGDIKNEEELEAWLQGRPPEMSVAFAARAALRALPLVKETLRSKPTYIVLPVFRALAFAWAAARHSISTKGYAAPPIDLAHFSPNSTAASEAAAAAQAARAVVSTPALVGGVLEFVRNAARLADESSGHLFWHGDGGHTPAEWIVGPAWAKAAFWAAVSSDATHVEEGAAASDIAGSPLWQQGQPDQLQSLWQEMKAALHAAMQDWQVWVIWYDDRLAGRVREEERELAYVRIEEALWNQGPAIVNAEIKRRIDEFESPPPIAGAAAQHHSVVLAAWQSADAALWMPHQRRQYVPDVLFNPVALADTPPAPVPPELSPVPEIPPQRPAALEPVWSNGKLVLPPRPARTDGDKRTNAAALKALRAELLELADDVEAEPSNFDKRAAAYLRRIAERVRDRPPQHELFRLAHAKEYLEAYGITVN